MRRLQAVSYNLQRRFGHQRLRRIVLGAIPFLILLTLWLMNGIFGWLAPVYIPPLAAVWEAIFTLQEDCSGLSRVLTLDYDCLLTTHILSSLGRVAMSLLIGIPAGVALGVLAGMHRRIGHVLEPIGVFANAVSGIAWMPLAIVWFGVGWLTTLFILLNTIFWLVFFNTLLVMRRGPVR